MGLRTAIALSVLALWAVQDTRSPEFRCWETCEVLDMQYVATEGCWCRCKDVDGLEYRDAIPDCL